MLFLSHIKTREESVLRCALARVMGPDDTPEGAAFSCLGSIRLLRINREACLCVSSHVRVPVLTHTCRAGRRVCWPRSRSENGLFEERNTR